MIDRWDMNVTVTPKGTPKFELKIYHEKLKKFQVIKGTDRRVVEQKGRVILSKWDETWGALAAKKKRELAQDQKRREVDEKKQIAGERTLNAQADLDNLNQILAHTLAVDDTIEWESLKNFAPFPKPKPTAPHPVEEPRAPELSPPPQATDIKYRAKINILDKLVKSRREAKENEARETYIRDLRNWEQERRDILLTHSTKMEIYKKYVDIRDNLYPAAIKKWEKDRNQYIKERDNTNLAIDETKSKYINMEPEAILEYCDLVLSNSKYPDFISQNFELDYGPDNKLLIVDYQMPSLNDMPTLKEVKYVQSKDQFEEKHITESQRNSYYDAVIYQLTLRSIHELYEADKIKAISSIVFNGHINTIDQATGQELNACILSIQTTKEEFCQINLANVDPKACFKKLKGVGSSKLHSLTPIAPIVKINKEDSRFVSSYGVVDGLHEEDNLAVMNWEDFEHLIRELFEREFSSSGGEVKVTRASRDGGVDAVVFDPDPIRGGKIVIQAKRYTNTVGVSAVRDLYGTVMNEGAIKGILVSTSDYGPDAYEFAKDKPLTLLSGNNLLHLLQRHGYKAKIDLRAAKMALSNK